ncbi:hypothetical protein P9112_005552 [Eukaryota sp. TZLM1-RC]
MELDLSDNRPSPFTGWYGYFLPDVDTATVGEFQAYGGAILNQLPQPDINPNVLVFGVQYPDDFPPHLLLVLPTFVSHCVRVGEVTELDRFLVPPFKYTDVDMNNLSDLLLLVPPMPDDVQIGEPQPI